jgi:hypothetical protein
MTRIVVVLVVCAVVQVSAFADMITFDSQLTSAAGDYTLTTNVAGATVYDFESVGTTPTIAGNWNVISGSATNKYAAPYCVPEGRADATKYLTVPWNLGGSPTPYSAEITFGQDYNYLGFFWGSIDKYNTATFFNDGVKVAEFTGDDVINPDNLTGNQTASETNKYVNFFLDNSFDKIRLTSTSYAFELDNLAVSVVPVPGAVLLGFLGLSAAGMRLRKRA